MRRPSRKRFFSIGDGDAAAGADKWYYDDRPRASSSETAAEQEGYALEYAAPEGRPPEVRESSPEPTADQKGYALEYAAPVVRGSIPEPAMKQKAHDLEYAALCGAKVL